MIVGERLRQARIITGLTQTGLAKKLGIRQPAIVQFEKSARQPSPKTLEAISFATGFPVSFFSQEQRTSFPLGTLLFRGKKRMLVRERSEAHELASVLFEAIERLTRSMKERSVKVPILTDSRPRQAAVLTRSALGLSPEGPAKNLIHHLEAAGVVVMALPRPLPNRDAFSAWTASDSPVIALSPEKPGDRQRWSAAHELGHLVIHRQIKNNKANLEREANDFAGELLMPQQSYQRELVSCAINK